jgi:hypothetical protein
MRPHFLPVFLVTWTTTGFIITYLWSWWLGHWNGHLPPFLSGTIDLSPEACLGGLVLCIAGFAFFAVVLIRWELGPKTRASHAWLAIGAASALSLCGVGTFRHHNIPAAHLAFAVIFFVGANTYLTGSFLGERHLLNPRTRLLRGTLSILAILFFFGYFIFMMMARFSSLLPWMTSLDVSATFEILMVGTFLAHNLTYYQEFRNIRVVFRVRPLQDEHDAVEELASF